MTTEEAEAPTLLAELAAALVRLETREEAALAALEAALEALEAALVAAELTDDEAEEAELLALAPAPPAGAY